MVFIFFLNLGLGWRKSKFVHSVNENFALYEFSLLLSSQTNKQTNKQKVMKSIENCTDRNNFEDSY
jgi:hypothetical protein